MNTLTIERSFHVRSGPESRKEIEAGPERELIAPAGRIPRVSRLMALAIRFDQMLREGLVADYTVLAELGHVTRSRVCQIMNLLQLAPDIQEAILFLPRVERGRDSVRMWELQPIAGVLDWRKQRRMWAMLMPDMMAVSTPIFIQPALVHHEP